MDIEKSLLGPEVNRIIGKKENNNTNEVYHEIILHTVKNDIPITRIIDLEVLEDYNNNYAEERFVEALCPMGDLVKFIYPHRNNLEISIIKILGGVRELNRYKLVVNNIDEKFGSGLYKNLSYKELNEREAFKLKGQCIDLAIEASRLKNVEGIYRDIDVSSLMVGLIHEKLQEIKVNGQPIKPFINIIDVDNKRLYKHIMIPSGTKLIDLATYIQETDYGVYNGHIGFYATKMKMGTEFNRSEANKELNTFIYPLYRVKDIEKANNKLIIYNIPNIKYSMVENTYIIDGNDIRIISTEDSKKLNTGDTEFMDKGVGYTMLDPNLVMNRPVAVNEKEVINDMSYNNKDTFMKERSDGAHYRQHRRPDDNQYEIRSNYLKEDGDLLQIKWNFSNTKYLLPGMAIVYTYLGDNNDVIRLNGILQSHYTVYNQSSKMASTILNIHVEKDKNELS